MVARWHSDSGWLLCENIQRFALPALYLRGRNLTGEIPPELGNLKNLTYLDLQRNKLTGEIPPELGELVNLERLALAGNALIGSIPSELGRLANLWLLRLEGNNLDGCIPTELLARPALQITHSGLTPC